MWLEINNVTESQDLQLQILLSLKDLKEMYYSKPCNRTIPFAMINFTTVQDWSCMFEVIKLMQISTFMSKKHGYDQH